MTLQNADVKEWYLELSTIDKHLEQSANKILENCERLSSVIPSSPQSDRIVASIIEQCTFHDVNSQRLRKIIKSLQLIMQGKFPEIAGGIATGPQRPGEALSQEDVENILRNSL